MDRRELEIMLNEAFDRGIVSVGHLVHETVEVGFLNELGRTVGFTLNGWKEAIETIPVDLFDSFDDGRGRERFLSVCKALGGKVPQNTYRGELVSALADVLMVEEAAPALGALIRTGQREAKGLLRLRPRRPRQRPGGRPGLPVLDLSGCGRPEGLPGFRSGSGQRSRYAHPWRIPHGGRLLHHGRLG